MALYAAQVYLYTILIFGAAIYNLLLLTYYLPRYIPMIIPAPMLALFLLITPLAISLRISYSKYRDTRNLTAQLEEKYPHLRERLSTLVEISDRAHQTQDPFSQSLMLRLQSDMSQLIDRFHFQRAMPVRNIVIPLVLIVLFLGVGGLHAAVCHDFFNVGFSRLTQPLPAQHPKKILAPLAHFEIQVIPGNAEIPRASHVMVQAVMEDYQPKKVELYVKSKDDRAWQVFPMASKDTRRYEHFLSHVMGDTFYFVKADHQESPVYRIKIFESLRIERAAWQLQFPSNTRIKAQTRQGWGDPITIPQGTRIYLELHLNQSVEPGWIVEQGEKRFELQPLSEKVLRTTFIVERDYVLELNVQSKSKEILQAETVRIQALPDLPPFLEVLEPQIQNYVFPSQEIPFKVSVNDDYGVSTVTLVIRCQGKEERMDWLKSKGREKVAMKPLLRLEQFRLESRDMVFAFIEVRDNFQGKDPTHVVRSPAFVFLIRDYIEEYKIQSEPPTEPSLRELFEDILSEQEKIMTDTWDVISMPPIEGPKGVDSTEDAMGQKNA